MSILESETFTDVLQSLPISSSGLMTVTFNEKYIEDIQEKHLDEDEEDDAEDGLWKGTEKRIISDKDDPKDTEYGGFWYLKGKRSQEKLMKFYEKFGFIEDSKVHTDWCIFNEIPYPSMRCHLE